MERRLFLAALSSALIFPRALVASMPKIALCGDSNGTTAYVTQDQLYLTIVAQALGYQNVANYAVSGKTAVEIKAQVVQAIADGATLILINAGTNNFSQGYQNPAGPIIDEIIAQDTAMIELCKTANVKCVIMSPILPNTITQTYRHIELGKRLSALCLDQGVDYVPVAESMLQKFDGGNITGWYTIDGWHGLSVWHQFVADMIIRRQVAVSTPTATTIFQLNTVGADNSTVFNDCSEFARAVTTYGNVHIEGNAAVFAGGSDVLKIPDSDDFAFGTQNFSIEANVKFAAANGIILLHLQASGDYLIFDSNAGKLRFQCLTSGQIPINVQSSWTPTLGQEYSLKVTRIGSTFRLFVDGTLLGSPAICAAPVPNYIGQPAIGTNLNGRISNLAVKVG